MKQIKQFAHIIFLLAAAFCMITSLWTCFFLYQQHYLTGLNFGIIGGLLMIAAMAYIIENH